jgi:hypothetical protein
MDVSIFKAYDVRGIYPDQMDEALRDTALRNSAPRLTPIAGLRRRYVAGASPVAVGTLVWLALILEDLRVPSGVHRRGTRQRCGRLPRAPESAAVPARTRLTALPRPAPDRQRGRTSAPAFFTWQRLSLAVAGASWEVLGRSRVPAERASEDRPAPKAVGKRRPSRRAGSARRSPLAQGRPGGIPGVHSGPWRDSSANPLAVPRRPVERMPLRHALA